MPLSRDLRNGPRNHFVGALASSLASLGDDLRRLSVELSGRSALPDDDIAEVETLIARAHAELDRASTTLVYSRPALSTPGAGNDFMGLWTEAQRASAEMTGAQS